MKRFTLTRCLKALWLGDTFVLLCSFYWGLGRSPKTNVVSGANSFQAARSAGRSERSERRVGDAVGGREVVFLA
jgi:hypothetical protein